MHNRHGDVVSMVDSSGTVINSYAYDSYGNVISQVEGTYNPFGYAGEHQSATESIIYLRNRIYKPSIGRFLQEDPIRDGTNWYVYCNSNPLNFMDPTGLALKLLGSEDEVQVIFEELKKLTNDELVLTRKHDTETGEMLDVYELSISKRNSGNLKHGTELIRRIDDNSEPVTIQFAYYDQGNSYAFGHNSVYFNPSFNPDIPTVVNGYVKMQTRPNHIGLAHELIHADHDLRNLEERASTKVEYSYKISKNEYQTENATREEYATIGIDYCVPGDITENMIRKEQGERERGAYSQKSY